MKVLKTQLAQHWQTLPVERRRYLAIGLVGLALIGVVMLGIRPAWRVLSDHDARRAQLDTQLAQMQSQARLVAALRNKPAPNPEQASRVLQQQVQAHLGTGSSLSLQGGEAVIVFKVVSAQSLADFLSHARLDASSLPTQARLARTDAPEGKSGVYWSGTLHLRLPSTPAS